MRIGLNPPDPQRVSTDQTSTSSTVHQAARAAGENADTFSSDSLTLSALASRALQMPEIRQDKVASLQQSIISGQYQVDPQSIAAAMLGR
ncbi:MAG: flagellar biosynthesis anti-sigma factor FlgM [Terriglobales bacterium]